MDKLKIVGSVCEYNPFHYGHKYNIEYSKEQLGANASVCVMSGSFVQRGDVAIYDKWRRAETAVKNGIDLVLELPVYYVLQSAQSFALGAIKLLDTLGVVDYVTFGSECGNLQILNEIADILINEPDSFKKTLKCELEKGRGYPFAINKAIESCIADDVELMPNDRLAVNYIKALKSIKSKIQPYTVKRENNYHAAENKSYDKFSSATAIRNLIINGEDVSKYAPLCNSPIYNMKNIENLILGYFRLMPPQFYKNTLGLEQGLQNRIAEFAKKSSTLEALIDNVSSKRYSRHVYNV